MKKKNVFPRVMLHATLILITLTFVVPLLIAIMISFSTENDIVTYGYSIIPRNFTMEAYRIVLKDASDLFNAYGITIISSLVGSTLAIFLCASIAYAVSQPEFRGSKFVMKYIIITMLFGGGLIPTYILNTQVYGLYENIWVHLVLGLVLGSNIILFKVSFSQIPKSLIEAAEIDGATETKVLWNVVVPMSKPIIAMVFFNTFIGRWNDYQTTMYYAPFTKSLQSVQYYMNQVIQDAELVRQTYKMFDISGSGSVPVETLRFAICVLGAAPILIVFPLVQKYFAKGIAVGAVKE